MEFKSAFYETGENTIPGMVKATNDTYLTIVH